MHSACLRQVSAGPTSAFCFSFAQYLGLTKTRQATGGMKQPLLAFAEDIVNITPQTDCQEQKTSQGVLVLPQPAG